MDSDHQETKSHMEDLEQRILDFVNRSGYRPAKARAIARKLKLSEDQAADVKRAVKLLVRRGQLSYAANRLVGPADPSDPKGNRIIGEFQRTPKGFGFVRPIAASRSPVANAKKAASRVRLAGM